MLHHRQLDHYEALIEILTVFTESEIGGEIKFNNERIADYLNSFGAAAATMDCQTVEDFCQSVTDDILAGYPIWRLLELPEWTLRMVEDTFSRDLAILRQEREKKYKCLTCKYLKVVNTEIGTFYECLYHKPSNTCGRERHRISRREEPFKLKTRCKNYALVK